MSGEDGTRKKRKREDKVFGDDTIEWFEGHHEYLSTMFACNVYLRGDDTPYPSVEVIQLYRGYLIS